MPTTCPARSTRAPPLLPGLIDADVWIVSGSVAPGDPARTTSRTGSWQPGTAILRWNQNHDRAGNDTVRTHQSRGGGSILTRRSRVHIGAAVDARGQAGGTGLPLSHDIVLQQLLHASCIAGTSPLRGGGLSRRLSLAGRPAQHDEVIAMTTTRQPRRERSGWAMTALRRAIGALRHVNDEQVRASEAIFRSARFPQPRPRPANPARGSGAPAGPPGHAAAATHGTGKAA